MREVGTLEARNSLSALIEEVGKVGEIAITRHGKPVARLVPAAFRANDSNATRELVRSVREMRKHVRPDHDGLTVRDHIEMGRRY